MIIDFHTHIFPPKIIQNRQRYIDSDPLFALLYSNPKAKLASAEDLISSMDGHGINRSVILNIDWQDSETCHETNDYIMESVVRYPSRLTGFCMVKLNFPEFAIPEIKRCIQGGCKGIGELRPEVSLLSNPSALKTIMNIIVESNLILLTHTSEPVGHLYSGKGNITPETLYPFIKTFPDLKMVCSHWGGGLPFYALMPEVKNTLKNVFFDSAASPFLYRPEIYHQVVTLVGLEKVIFGTDFPLLSPERLLKEVHASDLSGEERDRFLSQNAKILLGLE
jgi:uncharacterized protein